MVTQGELWVLPADHVRRGHSTEREGFGLLEPLQVGVPFWCTYRHVTAVALIDAYDRQPIT